MNDLDQIAAAIVGTIGGIFLLLFVMAAIDPQTDKRPARQHLPESSAPHPGG